MGKKRGEGESQHIIIIRPTHQLIFTLKECHTFGLITFTTAPMFLFLGVTNQGERAVSTLLTFPGPVV